MLPVDFGIAFTRPLISANWRNNWSLRISKIAIILVEIRKVILSGIAWNILQAGDCPPIRVAVTGNYLLKSKQTHQQPNTMSTSTCSLAGSKKSHFFVSLLQLASEEKADEEIEGATTTIHENAVRLVPDMLDYIYSAQNILHITTENAVGLLHLAQFFTIRAMATKVLSFIYEDMSVENMRTYQTSAFAFDDLQIMTVCSSRCAEQIKDISSDSLLLRDMDASFLLDIIACPRKDRNCCSGHMSKLVSAYCDLHREKVDATVFDEVTLAEYLPVISKDVALKMLLLEANIVPESVIRKKLTCLQRRCVAALTCPSNPSSTTHSQKEWDDARATLCKLPKKVLIEIISASIKI